MTMNEDIAMFPIYGLSQGKLIPLSIENVNQYNHTTHQLHHYIKQQNYRKNKAWFDERGIKQKLILLPVWVHLAVHQSPAGANLSDEEFKEKVGISRWELIFNRRHSEY